MIRNETKKWIRLDNAALLFPAGSSKKNSRVFRITCELNEEVEPETLQLALDATVKLHPDFVCCLRSGVFWHYLEHSRERPTVHPEKFTPCYPIYAGGKKRQMFYVSYYRRRMYMEVHHALTDGTGGMLFFAALITNYLRYAHPDELADLPEPSLGAPPSRLSEDAFAKYFKGSSNRVRIKLPRAAQLSGRRTVDRSYRIIEGCAPVSMVLELARRHKTTVAVLLGAIYMRSIADTLSDLEKKRPVVVLVPVNLRGYFESPTMRNFFVTTSVSYDFSKGPGDLESLIADISGQLKSQLTKDSLSARIDSMVCMQRDPLMRIAPLFMKDAAMKLSKAINEKGETAVLSNVGRASMPDALSPYIKLISGTMSTSNMHLIVFSYGERMTLTFSSSFEENNVALGFFRALAAEGVPIELSTNYNQ